MIVDEMDLASEALETTPWQPEAYERARMTLQAAMNETQPAPGATSEAAAVRGSGFFRKGNRRGGSLSTGRKLGVGAGVGALAAAGALVLAVTAVSQSPAPIKSVAVAQSPLLSLAAEITASSGALPGDASLIIRTQTDGSLAPQVSYNLYTDAGAFYGGGDKKSTEQAIARHENEADGITAKEVAAARYAVSGNLTAARKRMLNASPNDLGLSAAARKAIWDKTRAQREKVYKEKGGTAPVNPPSGKALQEEIGNTLWNNSVDALSAGAGSPQVRAGVLRLLSTIPEVTVAKSTTDGQPTLTLTAGSALFDGGAPQVLTIDAKTGMPIKSVFRAQGNVTSSVSTFKVSRVSLAGIKAGKF